MNTTSRALLSRDRVDRARGPVRRLIWPARVVAAMATLLLVIAAVAPAGAQPGGSPFGQPGGFGPGGQADFNQVQPGQEVTARAIASRPFVEPGGELALVVILDTAPGWKVWPNAEAELPSEIAGFAIRTAAWIDDATAPEKMVADKPALAAPSWLAAYWPAQWPATSLSANPLGDPPQVPVLKGEVPIIIPVRLAADIAPGAYELSAAVYFQPCDPQTCLQPEVRTVTASFKVVPAEDTRISTLHRRADQLLAGFDQGAFSAEPLWTPGTGAPSAQPDNAGTTPPGDDQPDAVASTRNFFGIELASEGIVGWLALLLASLVGGALLNLMPCVLPVIPLKIMTLAHHAKTPGKTMALGIWMALGVAAFWTAVGIPVALTSNSIDPSTVFSLWPVTLGLGLFIAVMGLGIMGLFTLRLPNSISSINPKADSPQGSFVFGVMTAVLGLPCFGPIVGGLFGAGAALPPSTIMTVFIGLGVGMAAPYLVLSARPGLVKKIPQAGPAGDLLKNFMGLLMLAAGAYFVVNGGKTLLKGHPYLGAELEWVIAGLFVVAAGVLALAKTRVAARSTHGRAIVAFVGLASIGLSAWAVGGIVREARHEYDERQAALANAPTSAGVVPGVWLEFSEARLQQAIDADKAVFIDFTADWCITCRAAKAKVLDVDPVRSRLRAGDVVIFEADFDKPEVKRFLKDQLGRTGIPAWVVYGPAYEQPRMVNNIFSSGEVAELLENAGGVVDPAAEGQAGAPDMTRPDGPAQARTAAADR